jgi:hypothetical protein
MRNTTAVEYTMYRIYDRTGKLMMSSDERCRYSPREELSLIEAGHRITLGTQRITKSHVLNLLKEEERK